MNYSFHYFQKQERNQNRAHGPIDIGSDAGDEGALRYLSENRKIRGRVTKREKSQG